MRTRLLHTVLSTDPEAAIDTGHAANDERHGTLITPGIPAKSATALADATNSDDDDYLGEYAGI